MYNKDVETMNQIIDLINCFTTLISVFTEISKLIHFLLPQSEEQFKFNNKYYFCLEKNHLFFPHFILQKPVHSPAEQVPYA